MTTATYQSGEVTALHHAFRETSCWIFDLDNTLYPASCNLFVQVDQRIRRFIMDHFAIGPDEARRLQKSYFHEYGTTLNGLMSRHGIDPGPYLDYVHDIDLHPIEPSPKLDAALRRLPGRKLIYTNGSCRHAERVTDRLGVAHHFDGVFDIVAAGFVPKPEPPPYSVLVERFALHPKHSVMVEDISRNLAPAHALGMTTVWLRCDHEWSSGDASDPHVHHVIGDLVTWLEAIGPRE